MRVHGEIPGRTFLEELHPVGAPNETLISDTALVAGDPDHSAPGGSSRETGAGRLQQPGRDRPTPSRRALCRPTSPRRHDRGRTYGQRPRGKVRSMI